MDTTRNDPIKVVVYDVQPVSKLRRDTTRDLTRDSTPDTHTAKDRTKVAIMESPSTNDDNDDDDDYKARRRSRHEEKDQQYYKRRDKKKKKQKKRSKSSRRDDEDDDDDDDNRRRSRKRRRYDDDRRRRNYSDESDDSVEKRKEKKSRKSKKERKKEKSSSSKRKKRSKDATSTTIPKGLERNYELADALYALLDNHPALATDLPVMLVRMAGGGASFDLSQMPDRTASAGLERVFETMSAFGVQKDSKGSWTWKAPDGANHKGANNYDLVLVKVARNLLDQIGFTMEAVNNYEKPPLQEVHPKDNSTTTQEESKPDSTSSSTLQRETTNLLEKFGRLDSTLPNQLGQLCSMIMEGQSVSVDGIPDDNLRDALESLFRVVGLERSEMEEEEEEENDSDKEDDDDDGNDDPSYGYSIPETGTDFARDNLLSVLTACKQRAEKGAGLPGRKLKGPLPQHMANQYGDNDRPAADDDDDDDDFEGPVPIGSAAAQKRGPAVSKETVAAMAEHRQRQLDELDPEGVQRASRPGEREEWMLTPGEHDLLKGIQSGSVMLKNRNFENKKVSSSLQPEEVAMDPSVQAQVDAIVEAHNEARGPSLMDMHRQKKAADKQKKEGGGNEWKWNREEDLDSGRRVDKEALRMILGGAGTGLKDKFQGGLSRG